MKASVVTCLRCNAEYEETTTRFCGRCGNDIRPSERGGRAQEGAGPAPLIGRVIDGRYRILEQIGAGGMGAVYRVEHLAMGKLAAMKILHPALTQEPDVARRFRREAEAVSRLSHPNTVQVFDFGKANGATYLVMELVRGEDLGALLRRDGPLPFARLAAILVQICEALTDAHEAGVIHRDLKPENILVSRTRDGRDLVKVLDFGLAKLRDAEELNQVTARGSLVGTPFYMSPEQIRGESLDPRSDLYSLGALGYRLLTGHHPFSAPTPVGVLTQHLTDKLVPPSRRRPDLEIPAAADEIVQRAMSKRRESRYASAEAMREAIERAAENDARSTEVQALDALRRDSDREPTGSSTTPTPSRMAREDFDSYERGLRLRRWIGAGLVPVLLAGAAAGFFLFHHLSGARARATEEEPNDDAATANRLDPGHPIRGLIGKRVALEESDRDFYVLTVPTGTHALRIQLTGIPTMDVKLELFDAGGRELAESDTGGRGDGETIPDYGLHGGDYFVEVREVWVAGRPASENVSDWYSLTATIKPPDPARELEPNDLPDAANRIGIAAPVRGLLSQPGDVDWFALQDSRGGPVDLEVTGVPEVDLRLVVLPLGDRSVLPPPLPPGARIGDAGGPGEGEGLRQLSLPAGKTLLLAVERKEAVRPAEPSAPSAASAAPPLVGRDRPYVLTLRRSP